MILHQCPSFTFKPNGTYPIDTPTSIRIVDGLNHHAKINGKSSSRNFAPANFAACAKTDAKLNWRCLRQPKLGRPKEVPNDLRSLKTYKIKYNVEILPVNFLFWI